MPHARAEAAVDATCYGVDALEFHSSSRNADAGDGSVVENVKLSLVFWPEGVAVDFSRKRDGVSKKTDGLPVSAPDLIHHHLIFVTLTYVFSVDGVKPSIVDAWLCVSNVLAESSATLDRVGQHQS